MSAYAADMKAILLKLDEALVAQIDDLRGDVPRTVWITQACEKHLANLAFSANLDEVLAVTLPMAFPPKDHLRLPVGPVASNPGSRLKVKR